MTEMKNDHDREIDDQKARQESETERLLALCEELKNALIRAERSRKRKTKLTPTVGEVLISRQPRDCPPPRDQ
jgi:hypothetical protein